MEIEMSKKTTISVFNPEGDDERVIWVDDTMYFVPDKNAKIEIDWDNRTIGFVRMVTTNAVVKVRTTIKP